MTHILIADDDQELCLLLKEYLLEEGFTIETANDGEVAIQKLSRSNYDLLILDVMMPKQNGFDTLAQLRQYSNLPVLMLTARGEKVDRIVGLEMGADDYVTKPCDPRELVARIRAITRRTNQPANQQNSRSTSVICVNNVKIDPDNRQVTLNEKSIELTTTEFDLLNLLVSQAGKLVTRESISEICLGKKLQPFDRSIDMHLSNVRKKLSDFAPGKPRIKTIRGNGYQYLIWPDEKTC